MKTHTHLIEALRKQSIDLTKLREEAWEKYSKSRSEINTLNYFNLLREEFSKKQELNIAIKSGLQKSP